MSLLVDPQSANPSAALWAQRPAIAVACGVLVNAAGEVLLAERPIGKVAAGKWEFPGGKIESGESASQALARELYEELGVEIADCEPLIRFRYDYSDRSVMLNTHCVRQWHGEPIPREGQRLQWRSPHDVADLDVLPTVAPIVRALRLPCHYVLTPPSFNPTELYAALAALPAGSLLRLRMPGEADAGYLAVAAELLHRSEALGLQLMIDGPLARLEAVSAAGWHATELEWRKLSRRPISADRWFAMSVHDAEGLAAARELEADFAVLGPVAPTPTHPNTAPLGWAQFERWVERAPLPVYALGGVGLGDLVTVRAHGGIGVAGIRAYWPALDLTL